MFSRSYSNMDYVFASVLHHINSKLSKVASYDIACQWSIHVLKRVKNLPPLVWLNAILQLAFLIPKLHIYSHKLLCQISYSFHLHPGVGNTNGESIERSHAFIGPFGTSTTEMGPGSRHDTLDDVWGYWNWLKLIFIGMSYLSSTRTFYNVFIPSANIIKKRLDSAMQELDSQWISFEAFTIQQSEHVQKWRDLIIEWESGRETEKNPYSLPQNGGSRYICMTCLLN